MQRNVGPYLNRDISLLQFVSRVLWQARDLDKPLLERLRFLCISGSVLDEFFEVRVSTLKQRLGLPHWTTDPDGLSAHEALRLINPITHQLVTEQYQLLNEQLLPSLASEGINILLRPDWSDVQAKWLEEYFNRELLPILSPIGLDSAHPFPRILNKSLNFIVSLNGIDVFGRRMEIAIMPAPRSLPRVVRLPTECSTLPFEFVSLASVIQAHMHLLFPSMEVKGSYQFRLTRNSNLIVDEEEIDDLLESLEVELPSRRYGKAVRLEMEHLCPEPLLDFLLSQFELRSDDAFLVKGPVNLNRLGSLYELIDRPELKFPTHTPKVSKDLSGDMFARIRQRDILLHHPYESFEPVLDLIRQAAVDPSVLVIKQTLYRTGVDSAIVDALEEAALAGKEVIVVVELKARFEEEANISLATRLQEAGAQVVFGVVGFKTHAKMLLIVRREANGLRRYVHLATGNYHVKNTRAYTDFGLMTCNIEMGEDVHNLFMQLTGLGHAKKMHRLHQAPFSLRQKLMDLIHFETEEAKAGRKALIRIKVNGLIDGQVIQTLYQASQAGVEIDLLVRGMCCIRPGVPELSENIRVRSVVGRFLEHTRVFNFYHGGEDLVYLSSADLMPRNLTRRIELAFPILDANLKNRVLKETFDTHIAEAQQAWELLPDGSYRLPNIVDVKPVVSNEPTYIQ